MNKNDHLKKTIYLLFVFATITTNLIAQEKDSLIIPKSADGLAEYSEIIPIDSVSNSDLYLFGLEWVSKKYKSGKSVIQTTDKEGGIIIGKAVTHTLVYNNMGIKKDGGYFSYTISIYCKDNKYKYVIDNITYNKGEMVLTPGADLAETFPHNWTGFIGNNKQTRREWQSFQRQADTEFQIIIEDLKKHMKNSKKKSEW
ncbi:MAG: hypothetical protein FD170_1109 [Bacteroidetes bacterium]|nr:MAG: hypothetical protein FD170_1109 [Bacteroidota bacterium]